MNLSRVHPSGWNRGRWGVTIVSMFVLQIGLLWIIGTRPSEPLPVTSPNFVWRLAPSELSQPTLPDWLWASDPTLFALAGPNGFSGSAWMNQTTRDYELPGFDEAPRWLALNPDWVGPNLQQFELTDVPMARLLDDRSSRLEATEIPLPPVRISARSVLRMDDNLKMRLVGSPAELPSWPANDLILNSVVQIAVDGTGSVVSATLLRNSEAGGGLAGNRTRSVDADRSALQIANGLRFLPVNSGPDSSGLIWGKLTFEWVSVAAAQAGPNPASSPVP